MAARFHFKLDPALELRRRRERECMLALAKVEQERTKLRAQIERIQAQLDEGRRDVRRMAGCQATSQATNQATSQAGNQAIAVGGPVAVDVAGIRLASVAAMSGAILLQRLAITMAGTERRLAAARELLLKAAVARKSVELLREKAYREHIRAEERRESNALDDIATAAFVRTTQAQTASEDEASAAAPAASSAR